LKDATFKICIFGDGGVGKTSLTKRYVTGLFDEGLKVTIGLDFYVKNIEIDDKSLSLQIWDFAGESRFRFLLPDYVKGASGGIFMYDITRYASIKKIDEWLLVFEKGLLGEEKRIPIIMVGGKADLDHKRAVRSEEAIELAKSRNFIGFLECSSKSGKNVEKLFTSLGHVMLKNAGLV
jgi:small GTP-binding protein